MNITKTFQAMAISQNTNSFGLYQMILKSQDGETFVSHASYLNVPKVGDKIELNQTFNKDGGRTNFHFSGHEMTIKID